jgi:hypothetical protein
MEGEPRIYRIVRFYRYRDTPSRTIKKHVTLSEAQAYCSREDTHGEGWFDGYEYMPGCSPRKDS